METIKIQINMEDWLSHYDLNKCREFFKNVHIRTVEEMVYGVYVFGFEQQGNVHYNHWCAISSAYFLKNVSDTNIRTNEALSWYWIDLVNGQIV